MMGLCTRRSERDEPTLRRWREIFAEFQSNIPLIPRVYSSVTATAGYARIRRESASARLRTWRARLWRKLRASLCGAQGLLRSGACYVRSHCARKLAAQSEMKTMI